jgi:predicted DNA-binding transcriptional regulator YafY
MNYDEPPLGFDCGWSPDMGRVCLSQDHIGSRFREEAKEPKLWFQPEELPGLIESLKQTVADVIPELLVQGEEHDALIKLLHEYLPHEPLAKKKGPPAAG